MPNSSSVNEEYLTLVIEKTVSTAIEKYEGKLHEHVDERVAMIQQSFVSAFPGGDPHGHRMAHEKYIDRARKCATFKEQFWGHFTLYGAIATIGWLTITFSTGLKARILEWLR